VVGQAHGIKEPNINKEQIGFSEQIKPPLIQNHHQNALGPSWIKFVVRRHY
jgi:hypothetical protein